jgi:hypothetical protein
VWIWVRDDGCKFWAGATQLQLALSAFNWANILAAVRGDSNKSPIEGSPRMHVEDDGPNQLKYITGLISSSIRQTYYMISYLVEL